MFTQLQPEKSTISTADFSVKIEQFCMINWHNFCIAKGIIETETRAGFETNVEAIYAKKFFPELK